MRVFGHGGPAFLGVALSLRARSAAELGSSNYALHHNHLSGAELSISTNHAHSPAVYRDSGVTGNTFIAHVCCRFYAVRNRQGGPRCGSLRSTSPAASSRITWVLAADRSST